MPRVYKSGPCTKCGGQKVRRKYGLICKPCLAVKAREHRKKYPDRYKGKGAGRWADPSYRSKTQERYQRKFREALYGLTIEKFNEMESAQNNCCAICKKARKLVVDHDHVTGRIRGLLCKGCNTALGVFGDSVRGLKQAIAYLETPQVVFDVLGGSVGVAFVKEAVT